MEELISLVYVSSATRPLHESEVIDILRASRQNNECQGITGMLLYRGGNFMQVLEGPNERVSDLLARLRHDPRHRGVLQLAKKVTHERSFPRWSMAFQDLDMLKATQEEAYSPFLATSLLDEQFCSHPEACYRLLLSFKNSMR